MGLLDFIKKAKSLQNPILTGGTTAAPTEIYGDADASGIFHAPIFFDPQSGRSATTGTVKAWHVPAGRSIVSGQRVLDIQTEIGLIPVRTRMNGHLAEVLAPVGTVVSPGQPLWRYAISKQAFQ